MFYNQLYSDLESSTRSSELPPWNVMPYATSQSNSKHYINQMINIWWTFCKHVQMLRYIAIHTMQQLCDKSSVVGILGVRYKKSSEIILLNRNLLILLNLEILCIISLMVYEFLILAFSWSVI